MKDHHHPYDDIMRRRNAIPGARANKDAGGHSQSDRYLFKRERGVFCFRDLPSTLSHSCHNNQEAFVALLERIVLQSCSRKFSCYSLLRSLCSRFLRVSTLAMKVRTIQKNNNEIVPSEASIMHFSHRTSHLRNFSVSIFHSLTFLLSCFMTVVGLSLLGSERQVQLHLDEIHVSAVTLATVTSLSDMLSKEKPSEDSLVLEIFQVPIDVLGKNRLEYLKSGNVMTASVTPIAPFRIRDNSGDIVTTTVPHDLIHHLKSTSGSPTVCGSTVARGLVSIDIDGDKSIPSMTKYIPIDTTAAGVPVATDHGTQRMLMESAKKRRLNDKDNDICEEIDAVFSPGGCLQEATCFIKFSRKKRVEKEVCLGVAKCGKRVKGKITVKSKTEYDEDYFQGECKTIVIPRWFDDCHCFLTKEGTQALNDWRKEPLPSIQCSSTSCSANGRGGEYLIFVTHCR